MTVLLESEIELGLVIHMDPDALRRAGGQFTGLDGRAPVYGPHLFACSGVDEVARTSEWLALYSRDAALRIPIFELHKRGHPGFVRWTSYTYVLHFWRAPNAAIIGVAKLDDLSTPAVRNRIVKPVMEILADGVDRAIHAARPGRFRR